MENNLLLNHPFWKFSFDLYRHAVVEKACLFMQDQYDFNVNLMLFIVWHAKNHGGMITKEQLQQMQQKMMLWNEFVTKPIRHEREQPVAEVAEYGQWLKVELIAESIEQWLLLKSFEQSAISKKDTNEQVQDAWQSIKNYAALKQVVFDDDALKQITALINCAFPQIHVGK